MPEVHAQAKITPALALMIDQKRTLKRKLGESEAFTICAVENHRGEPAPAPGMSNCLKIPILEGNEPKGEKDGKE